MKYEDNFYTQLKTALNPLTLVSDQDGISPYYLLYNIMQTSDENEEKYQLWDY